MEDEEEVDTETSSSSNSNELESMEEKVNDVAEETTNEEILKELRNIKKQNTRTHWLISTMIVLTVVWQLSEVSLVFKIKNGLTNPFKSVSGMIGGFVKKRQSEVNDVIQQVSEKQKEIVDPNYIPNLKSLELPSFDTTDEDDD